MPSYREHLAQIKSEIEQIDSPALSEALALIGLVAPFIFGPGTPG